MATDLIGLMQGVLNSGVVDQISRVVGESPTKTQAVVNGAVPSVLAGALNTATSSPPGANGLLSLISQGGFDKMLGNLGGLLGGGQSSVDQLIGSGKAVLGSLFGDKLGGVVGALSGASGVNQTTANSVLAMAAPAVMGLLGKQVSSGGLGASGLVNLLLSNKDAIARFAPAGLASALGLRSLGDLGGRAIQSVQQGAAGASSAARRWLPLVAVAAALIIVYLAVRGSGEKARDTASQAGTGGSAMVRKQTYVVLPGGGSLSVDQDTFLYNLAHYLGSTSDTAVPKTFTFDNLNFESGGTTLTPASNATVSDLTRVLAAYPNAQVKLVGYTDATGDVVGNKSLSLARARAVGDLLSKGGVATTRITTDGLGEDNPVAPNNTDEGRAKNRRIELVVTQK